MKKLACLCRALIIVMGGGLFTISNAPGAWPVDLIVSDDSIDFYEVELGDSLEERVLVRLVGNQALWVDFDDSSLPWEIRFSTDCPKLLVPNIACYLYFEFTPEEVGEVWGDFYLRDKQGRELHEISVYGEGVVED